MANVEVPPTLVRMEPPVLVDAADAAASASAAAASRVAAKGVDGSGLDDIVNAILPPRMWSQPDGTSWMQYTSKEPASRLDVFTLQEQLDQRLAQRQARLEGLCPVREELYRQCFDELIRQTVLGGPERGLLLLRVRDELRLTMDAYRTLYEASVTFGVRKQMQAEAGMPEAEAELKDLTERKKALEAQVAALRAKLDAAERRAEEKRALDERRRADELAYLRHQQKHLDGFLKSLPPAAGGGAK